MKAISLWQPWASLWLSNAKVNETRHWPTDVRGTVAVHAAQRFVKNDLPRRLVDVLEDEFGEDWRKALPTGALVGTVDLIDCRRIGGAFDAAHRDDVFCGNWEAGRYAWQRGAFRRFATPIPFKGLQGFFSVDDALIREAA